MLGGVCLFDYYFKKKLSWGKFDLTVTVWTVVIVNGSKWQQTGIDLVGVGSVCRGSFLAGMEWTLHSFLVLFRALFLGGCSLLLDLLTCESKWLGDRQVVTGWIFSRRPEQGTRRSSQGNLFESWLNEVPVYSYVPHFLGQIKGRVSLYWYW